MTGPILAIVAAWLALSLLTALWRDLAPEEIGESTWWLTHRPRTWARVRGAMVLWGLIFVVVGGLGYGVRGLWGAP